jgi:CxxC motif-containing protein (DUF1111 family)
MLPRTIATGLLGALLCVSCADEPAPPMSWAVDPRSGGALTVADNTRDAYARTAPTLAPERQNSFFVGNSFFNANWVTAPASTEGRDGLGPTFNTASCSACHFKDGRGRPPLTADEPFEGLLLRLSVPGEGAHGEPVDEPAYGGQFNHQSIQGVPSEGNAIVEYVERAERFADGTPASLRVPTVRFPRLSFGPMSAAVMVSPRVAPAMIGLGLLEAVPEAAVLALADPDDRDRDGVSGRPNRVWDATLGRAALGRFGWKANQPGLLQQTAGAFLGDMGITSSLFPDENCPPSQTACRAAARGGQPEIDDSKLAAVVLYSRALAVPARRDVDAPAVMRGAALFEQARCTSCHTPTLQTGADAPLPELAGQTFHPYTDLLLHDMGEGLADGRPDFLATGREWRTAPLWGVGLVERVNRHTFFLHDGRARNLTEAVLWHGGEAERARESFRAMSRADRDALLAFLQSL